MKSEDKADLKRAYKESVTRTGIFAIRSKQSGTAWVDASNTIDTIRNRIWFTLGLGNDRNAALQQEWNTAGADAIEFEILEIFPTDASKLELDDLMKTRKRHWIEELGGEAYR